MRFFALFLILGAWSVLAEPTVIREEINGIATYFINTHSGNSVVAGWLVPHGHLHDDAVKLAGRAHLFEHVIHRGSVGYEDGEKAFSELGVRSGGGVNAATGDILTYYYAAMHVSALPELVPYHASLLKQPTFDPDFFEAEKKVVMNEALEYQNQDNTALNGATYYHLLPPGHPMKMFTIGTQDQLAAMTVDDLKRLYYSQYSRAILVVSGNFDRPEISLSEARKLLLENYALPNIANDPHGFTGPLEPHSGLKEFPSFEKEGPARYLQISTPNQARALDMKIELPNLPTHRESGVLETFLDLTGLNFPGGFQRILMDRGWIEGMGSHFTKVNNKVYVTLRFSLTGEGAKQREQIPALMFDYLDHLKAHPLAPEIMKFLERRNIASYELATQGSRAAMRHLGETLSQGYAPEESFDFHKHYAGISSEEFLAVLKQFDWKRLLVGYMGPDVESATESDLFTGRKIAIGSLERRSVDKLQDQELAVHFPELNIPFADKPRGEPGSEKIEEYSWRSDRAVARISHQAPTVGLALTLQLTPLSAQEQVALQLWLSAFKERHQAELELMNGLSLGIPVPAVNRSALKVLTEGNSEAVLWSIEWFFDAVSNFVPTDEEITKLTNRMKVSLLRGQDEFTALVAAKAAQGLVWEGRYLPQELLAALEEPIDVHVTALSAFQRGVQIEASSSGDFRKEELDRMREKIRSRLPWVLDAEPEPVQNLDENLHFWNPLIESKSEEALGLTRLYFSPENISEESAALTVFAKALKEAIFLKNRVDQQLGYVHGAAYIRSSQGGNLMLFGQTDKKEQWPLVVSGWQEVEETVRAGQLSPDGFRNEIVGTQRSFALEPLSQGEDAAELWDFYFELGDLHAKQKIASYFDGLTSQKIHEAGLRVMNSPYLEVSATRENCNDYLANAAEVRLRILSPEES